jgi:hypothetical protein
VNFYVLTNLSLMNSQNRIKIKNDYRFAQCSGITYFYESLFPTLTPILLAYISPAKKICGSLRFLYPHASLTRKHHCLYEKSKSMSYL